MNYGEVKEFDIANGVGVRVSLFVAGCRHRCEGCFNPGMWQFGSGRPFDADAEDMVMHALESPVVRGLSVLGGEPLEPENQRPVLSLLRRVRRELPRKDVWLWTGFVLDDLLSGGSRADTDVLMDVLGEVDVLVDGPFVLQRRDLTLRFRGSGNQRVIDLRRTLSEGHVVPWSDGAVLGSRRWTI